MSQNSDTPDTPPEVIARQSRAVPLTASTAELIGAKSYQTESGKMSDDEQFRQVANVAAKAARTRAEAFAGPNPLKGLSPDQITAIRARSYEDAPEQNPQVGYRTPAYVNWIWANHPRDAVVLYAYKDVWPTALPTDWPPAASVMVEPVEDVKPALNGAALPVASSRRVYTEDEVAAMLAAVRKEQAPAKPAKRSYTRKANPQPVTT